MNRGGVDSSRSDLKRRFVEDIDDLFELDPSDVVLFEQHLNALQFKAYGTVGVEK